jgi:O-antigen/teichoic acid export membrane protein
MVAGAMSGPPTGANAPPPRGRLRLGQAAFASVYGDLILAVLSLAFVPYLIRQLGTEPYGILGIVSVLAGQLGVLHFGVGTAATRLVAESVARGGGGLVPRFVGVAVVGAAASLLVGAVFYLLAPLAWRGGFNVSAATLPLALASVPAAATLVALTPASAAVYGVLTGREQFLFAAALRLYQGAGRLIAAVAVVAVGGGIASVFWAQAVVDLSAVVAGAVRSGNSLSRQGAASRVGGEAAVGDAADGGAAGAGERSALAGVAAVLAIGIPFALVSLLSGLLTDAEKLAIGLARSLEDFTYYTVPFNAVIKVTVLSGAVVRVLMPRVAALGARGDDAEARVLTERSDRILVTAMVGALAPLIALAPELLRLWVGPDFELNSTMATRVLLVGIAVNTAAFPAHAALLARGRPGHLTALYAAELVLHLVVVYALVTQLGLVGAAAAWTIRVVVDTLAQRRLAGRALSAPLRDGADLWGTLILLASFAGIAPLLGFWARLAIGAALAAASALRLARGRDAVMLLDSVLPWRWGEGRTS